MKVSLRAWRYFSTVFFLFFLLANQSSALPNAKTRDFSAVQIQWQALANCPYIQTAEYHESQLLIHCAKIDLTAPGLKVDLFPKKFLSRETFYVEDICKKSGAILAFNTTPFYVHENGAQKKHSTAGLCVNNKKIYSRPLTSYCALGLFGFETDAPESERRAKIFSSQKDQELKEAAYASGGFWQILKDKKIIQFKELRDSRTAVGLDQ
ncbi:MAG: hypothetical protein K6A42_05440, partial [Treponema sp.]|nr:hypothetical protein [Treponema sp.]